MGHLDAKMRAEMTSFGLWLDTSRLTADQTVTQILNRAGEAVIAE